MLNSPRRGHRRRHQPGDAGRARPHRKLPVLPKREVAEHILERALELRSQAARARSPRRSAHTPRREHADRMTDERKEARRHRPPAAPLPRTRARAPAAGRTARRRASTAQREKWFPPAYRHAGDGGPVRGGDSSPRAGWRSGAGTSVGVARMATPSGHPRSGPGPPVARTPECHPPQRTCSASHEARDHAEEERRPAPRRTAAKHVRRGPEPAGLDERAATCHRIAPGARHDRGGSRARARNAGCARRRTKAVPGVGTGAQRDRVRGRGAGRRRRPARRAVRRPRRPAARPRSSRPWTTRSSFPACRSAARRSSSATCSSAGHPRIAIRCRTRSRSCSPYLRAPARRAPAAHHLLPRQVRRRAAGGRRRARSAGLRGQGLSLPGRQADRHLPPRGVPAEPELQAAGVGRHAAAGARVSIGLDPGRDPGRCQERRTEASMTDTISRAEHGLGGPVPPQALEPSARCWRRCCSTAKRSVARSRWSTRRSFYRAAHQKIFDAIVALYNRSERADLDHRVRGAAQARRPRSGGRGSRRSPQILEYATTTANLEEHIKIVHSKAVLRHLDSRHAGDPGGVVRGTRTRPPRSSIAPSSASSRSPTRACGRASCRAQVAAQARVRAHPDSCSSARRT